MQWNGGPLSPPQPDQPRPTARLTYEHPATAKRHELHLSGRDSGALDRLITAAVANVRDGGFRMVRTEMDVNGENWIYEYSPSGQVENIFRNGEVTP